MIIVISPAKSLDMEKSVPVETSQQPRLLDESRLLIEQLKGLEVSTIKDLMSISDKLAQLNVERYQEWKMPFSEDTAKASIFAFQGDVYQGFDADSMTLENLEQTEKRLRILSGLYGVLKPFDLMQAYRLEMGTSLQNERGKDLYAFWGNLITDLINADIEESGAKYLLNLASVEYFKSIKEDDISVPIISPSFIDEKNGKFKIISFYAKVARGRFAREVIEKNVFEVEQLRNISFDGYSFSEEQTKDLNKPVFVRTEAALAEFKK
jgi:cytoplasmic iron level regulating protein YaaA (DUF328/UPF0246 family)